MIERLVERAQAAGQLRADIRQTDIPFIVFVLTEATQLSRAVNPEIWRRYLTLILDGMRPRPGGRHPASGARHAAGGDGEEHAAGRAVAPLTFSADPSLPFLIHAIPLNNLHLHVHVQSVNE